MASLDASAAPVDAFPATISALLAVREACYAILKAFSLSFDDSSTSIEAFVVSHTSSLSHLNKSSPKPLPRLSMVPSRFHTPSDCPFTPLLLSPTPPGRPKLSDPSRNGFFVPRDAFLYPYMHVMRHLHVISAPLDASVVLHVANMVLTNAYCASHGTRYFIHILIPMLLACNALLYLVSDLETYFGQHCFLLHYCILVVRVRRFRAASPFREESQPVLCSFEAVY